MPAFEFNLLPTGALPWLIALGVAAASGVWLGGLDKVGGRETRRPWARRGRWRGGANASRANWPAGVPDVGSVAGQAAMLAEVAGATFRPQRLLNQAERRVLAALDAALAAQAPDWRAMAQVNLGEILTCPDTRAFRAINAKRVDLLVVDAAGWPVVAIEYQGTGHYLSNDAALRDAVKREALRRAGIALEEVRPDHDAVDVERIIQRAKAAAFAKASSRPQPKPDPIPTR